MLAYSFSPASLAGAVLAVAVAVLSDSVAGAFSSVLVASLLAVSPVVVSSVVAAVAPNFSTGVAGSLACGAGLSAWKDRIAQGKDTLYKHSIEGFQGKTGVMPPKGGSTASDEEMKAAVDYMVSKVS